MDAEKRVADVDVHIPWCVIDPTGQLIRKQRMRELAQRRLHKETADKEEFRRSLRRASSNRVLLESKESQPLPASKSAAAARHAGLQHPDGGEHNHKLPLLLRLTVFPAWDSLTTVALLFTVVVTPFEVGFLKAPETVADLNTLFFVNRVVDAVFIVDVVLQFFIMVPKQDGAAGVWGQSNDGTQRWETSLPAIAKRYTQGWFAIDVVSVAPFIFDILPLLNPDGGSSARGAKALRTIRALRLIKLLRLLRASRVFGHLKERISLPYTTLTLMKLAFQTVVIAHSIACIVAIITTFPDSPLDSALAELPPQPPRS